MVFAGHAHWRLECCLRWEGNNPTIYYGDYTGAAGAMRNEPWPLILQTPAIGPIGGDKFSQSPPHFRWIKIDASGAVLEARVTNPELQLKTGVLPS
jgi:hypothetical protein